MWHYVGAGRYADKVRNCIDLFGRDRVHVATAEAFRAAPDDVLQELWKFLDVPPQWVEDCHEVNASGAPRSGGMNRLLNPPPIVRRTLRRLTPALAVRAVVAARRRNLSAIPQMSDDTTQWLRDTFRDEVALTARIAGVDLSHWDY
jgi:hypothetical protein